MNPDSVIAHYNLGTIFTDNGNRDRAAAHYEKAIAINPDFPHAYNNLGLLEAEDETFELWLASFPDTPPPRAGSAAPTGSAVTTVPN